METTTLDKLPLGQEAIIAKVGGEGSILRRRLLDMGSRPAHALWYASAHRSATRWKSLCAATS